jgi:transcriptional regulator with GAF, ATPase, and Fis domain/GGDEF domain-containing protein
VADARGSEATHPVLATALQVAADATGSTGARLIEAGEGEEITSGVPLGVGGLTLVLPGARPREFGLIDLAARFVAQAWVWTAIATPGENAGGRVRRQNFLDWLGEKLKAASENTSELALVLVDIESSDPLAGMYGPVDIEEKVPLVYNAVERTVRGVDSVYRCDDATLAVVLPRCDRANAIKVSDRLRAGLDESSTRGRHSPALTTRLRIYSFPDEMTALLSGVRDEDIVKGDATSRIRLFAGLLAGTFRGNVVVFGADPRGNLAPVFALGCEAPVEVPRSAEEAFLAASATIVPRAGSGERGTMFLPVLADKGPAGVMLVESIHGVFGPAELELGKRIALVLGPGLAETRVGPPAVTVPGARSARKYRHSYDGIVGQSPAMHQVFDLLEKVIETDYPVIIEGESGTGKELIARAVHFNGKRREKPLIAENVAALNENLLEAELFGYEKGAFTGAETSRKGLFELADGGTLFLDEVADMRSGMQKDLLRILQEGIVRPVGGKRYFHVDVRIICASNKNLGQLVEEGKFRSDLFYRLNVWSIQMPSLRDRSEDIPLLVEHFLQKIAQKTETGLKTLGKGVLEALVNRDWPGNIRELKNEVARMVALSTGGEITLREVSKRPPSDPARPGLEKNDEVVTLEELERVHILKTLRYTNGNRARAAELLGINKATIYRKLKGYGIE